MAGNWTAAAAGFERLLELDDRAGVLSDPNLKVGILCALSESRIYLADLSAGERCAEEAVEVARRIGAGPALTRALYHAGWAAWYRDDHGAAGQLLDEAVTVGRACGHQGELGPALLNRARVYLAGGDWKRGRALIDELMGMTTAPNALMAGAGIARLLARESGEFDTAMTYAQRAFTIVNRRPVLQRPRLASVLLMRAVAALDLGDLDSAHSAAAQARALATRGDAGQAPDLATAAVAIEEQDWAVAESRLRQACKDLARPTATRSNLIDLGGILVSAGRLDEAGAIAGDVRRTTEPFSDEDSAKLLALDGRLHHARGDLAGARESLRTARDTYRRIGWDASAASIALHLGLVEADDGRREVAVDHLAEANPLSRRPSDQRQRQQLAAAVREA